MNYPKLILAGIFGLVLQATANAQIYESEDAEGVPEFSDTPTQGSEAVELPSTNLAEPQPAGSAAPQETQQAAPAGDGPAAGVDGEQAEGDSGAVYYGGDGEDDVRAQRRIDEDRIDNALPGNSGPGVGSPGAAVEPRPSEMGGAGEAGAIHNGREGHR